MTIFMAKELNDSLDDLLNSPVGEVRTAIHASESYIAKDFSETCPKCRGTGRFVSYSGRSLGQCFACKGAGKHTFKTSPEARAKSRTSAADRKANKKAEAVRDFQTTNPDVCAWINAKSCYFRFRRFHANRGRAMG